MPWNRIKRLKDVVSQGRCLKTHTCISMVLLNFSLIISFCGDCTIISVLDCLSGKKVPNKYYGLYQIHKILFSISFTLLYYLQIILFSDSEWLSQDYFNENLLK